MTNERNISHILAEYEARKQVIDKIKELEALVARVYPNNKVNVTIYQPVASSSSSEGIDFGSLSQLEKVRYVLRGFGRPMFLSDLQKQINDLGGDIPYPSLMSLLSRENGKAIKKFGRGLWGLPDQTEEHHENIRKRQRPE